MLKCDAGIEPIHADGGSGTQLGGEGADLTHGPKAGAGVLLPEPDPVHFFGLIVHDVVYPQSWVEIFGVVEGLYLHCAQTP